MQSSTTAYYRPPFTLRDSASTHLWSSFRGGGGWVGREGGYILGKRLILLVFSADILAAFHCFLPLWLNPLFSLSIYSLFPFLIFL